MTLAEAQLDNFDIASVALFAIQQHLEKFGLRVDSDTDIMLWDELAYLAKVSRVEEIK